ncbi:hypothetical protein BGZ79_003211 [Entomortierella chlamydospora]|nr:hypothetical protein BGZ79_003211 [Entomortierella chlamydospora]
MKSQTNARLMDTKQLLERLEYMTKVVSPAASERARKTQQAMVEKFNDTVLHNVFAVGAAVMALDPIKGDKFNPRYEGPFTVVRQDQAGSYVLRDPVGDILPRKYVASQLKLVLAEPQDPNAYVVQTILKHRPPKPSILRLEHEYLVRWKGYGPKDDTWEPYSNFFETKCIRDFWNARTNHRLTHRSRRNRSRQPRYYLQRMTNRKPNHPREIPGQGSRLDNSHTTSYRPNKNSRIQRGI